jgi:DNA-binding transcriptional MerR regulator
MERYTLNDLEKLTGIMADTIRVWERRYQLIKPHRTATNRRWYDDESLKYLINVSILYRNGLKISKISKFSESELEDKVESLAKSSFVSDTQIDSLILSMIKLNESAVNEVLLRSIINIGLEDTFTSIVFPFLRRVGIMWHTGSANIGAEHFISNIFRRRLITAIDSIPPAPSKDGLKVIMYLPENELHEMSLLFYAYIIRKMGHEILYLGQSTPIKALSEVSEYWNPDIFVTGELSGLLYEKPEEYLMRLSNTFTTQKILVSGSFADVADRLNYPNLFALRTVNDLKLLL